MKLITFTIEDYNKILKETRENVLVYFRDHPNNKDLVEKYGEGPHIVRQVTLGYAGPVLVFYNISRSLKASRFFLVMPTEKEFYPEELLI